VRIDVSLIVAVAGVIGCTGNIVTPSQPGDPSGVTLRDCPVVSSSPITIQPCTWASGGLVLNSPKLFCGGDNKMHLATSSPGSGATRFTVVFQGNSSFSGEVASTVLNIVLSTCVSVLNLTPLEIEFALTYTGDQGVEPGTATACMFRSKVDYTNFQIDQDVAQPFDGTLKDELHKALDDAIINSVFVPAGAPRRAGRCARWRPMP
jgi:hypothetical protein